MGGLCCLAVWLQVCWCCGCWFAFSDLQVAWFGVMHSGCLVVCFEGWLLPRVGWVGLV